MQFTILTAETGNTNIKSDVCENDYAIHFSGLATQRHRTSEQYAIEYIRPGTVSGNTAMLDGTSTQKYFKDKV